MSIKISDCGKIFIAKIPPQKARTKSRARKKKIKNFNSREFSFSTQSAENLFAIKNPVRTYTPFDSDGTASSRSRSLRISHPAQSEKSCPLLHPPLDSDGTAPSPPLADSLPRYPRLQSRTICTQKNRPCWSGFFRNVKNFISGRRIP